MEFQLILASTVAATSTDTGGATLVLGLVLGGVAALLLFAFLTSKLLGNKHEGIDDDYPIPLDEYDED